MSDVELGSGIVLRPYGEGTGSVAGYWFRHPIDVNELDAEPGICVGRVPTTGPGAWQVVSEEPLTLSPSVLCINHNFHGFVREGKWHAA